MQRAQTLLLLICLWIYLSCSITKVEAQVTARMNAGPTWLFPSYDDSDLIETAVSPGAGWQLSTSIGYSATRLFSITGGVTWLNTNYTVNRTGRFAGAHTRYSGNYLQAPVGVSVQVLSRGRLRASIGGQAIASFWMGGKMSGRIHNVLDTYTDVDENGQVATYVNWASFEGKRRVDNKFKIGGAIGVEALWSLNDKNDIIGSATFLQVASDHKIDQAGKSPPDRVFLIGLGIRTKFQ